MAAQAEKLKNKMKNGNQAPEKQDQPKDFNQQMAEYFGKMAPAVKMVLPGTLNTERFIRIALSEVRKNPRLLKCSMESVAGAVMQSAIVGLEPGPHGHVFLVPRWNKDIRSLECQFQMGYKGYIELAHRTSKMAYIDAEIVYEGDEFDFAHGSNKFLLHKPNIDSDKYGDPAFARYYYCFIKFKDGSETFKAMTRKQLIQHMEKFAPRDQQQNIVGPWTTNFDSMALKTPIRLLMKTTPITPEFQEQIARDETVANDLDNPRSVHADPYIDVESEDVKDDDEKQAS